MVLVGKSGFAVYRGPLQNYLFITNKNIKKLRRPPFLDQSDNARLHRFLKYAHIVHAAAEAADTDLLHVANFISPNDFAGAGINQFGLQRHGQRFPVSDVFAFIRDAVLGDGAG